MFSYMKRNLSSACWLCVDCVLTACWLCVDCVLTVCYYNGLQHLRGLKKHQRQGAKETGRGCAALLSASPPQEGQRFAAGPLLLQIPATKAFAIARLRNLYAQGAWASMCAYTATEDTMHDSFLHRCFCHTSKKEENKLPHLEPRIQRVKDSKPPGFKDSRIQAFKDSRIQAFKDSRAHGWKDSMIHVWAFVPRTTTPDFPELKLWIPPEQSIRRHLFQSTGAQT